MELCPETGAQTLFFALRETVSGAALQSDGMQDGRVATPEPEGERPLTSQFRCEWLLTPKHFVERPVAPGLRVDRPGSAGQLKRPNMDVHVGRRLLAQLTRAVTTGKGEISRFAQAGVSGRSLYGTW